MPIEYFYLEDYLKTDETSVVKQKYFALLRQLTDVVDVTDETFVENVKNIHKMGAIFIGVCGETIVCSGTIIIEPKLIHGCKPVGHIEDIVVLSSYRGKNIGGDLLKVLLDYAYHKKCYKVILDCKDTLETFYKRSGFSKHGIQMSLYF